MTDEIYVVKDKDGKSVGFSNQCSYKHQDKFMSNLTIHEYIPAPHWVPVSERLPEPDTPVLVWLSGDAEPRFDVDYVDVCPEYGHDFFSNYDGEVTHWLLPAPPKEG